MWVRSTVTESSDVGDTVWTVGAAVRVVQAKAAAGRVLPMLLAEADADTTDVSRAKGAVQVAL